MYIFLKTKRTNRMSLMCWFQIYEHIMSLKLNFDWNERCKVKINSYTVFLEDPIDVTVLKTYQMYIYLCSTHEGLHNLIFCLLKIFNFWKTVIFNVFLYEEDTDFHCFLQAQNIWQIYFFHMMRNHDNIEFFLNYAVWPKHCLK